jgi:hypothetical protein
VIFVRTRPLHETALFGAAYCVPSAGIADAITGRPGPATALIVSMGQVTESP